MIVDVIINCGYCYNVMMCEGVTAHQCDDVILPTSHYDDIK